LRMGFTITFRVVSFSASRPAALATTRRAPRLLQALVCRVSSTRSLPRRLAKRWSSVFPRAGGARLPYCTAPPGLQRGHRERHDPPGPGRSPGRTIMVAISNRPFLNLFVSDGWVEDCGPKKRPKGKKKKKKTRFATQSNGDKTKKQNGDKKHKIKKNKYSDTMKRTHEEKSKKR